MSKQKPHVHLGYVGDLSPEQEGCFKQVKEWINENDVTHNPWHDDCFLLKFCRARNFNLEKV